MDRIYLDYAASTPLDPRVLEAMLPFLREVHGNASSIHQDGQSARRAIDEARSTIIENIGAFSPHEICFTSGGTESCNMAVFGAAFARQDRGKHLVVSAIEHAAVLEPARYLCDNFGFELNEVKPNKDGIVEVADLKAALRPDTIFVSLMMANNEVGTIQPVREAAGICRERDILFHTDACQAAPHLPIDVAELGVDLLTLNGSKIYGPKGSGILYIREGLKITPLIHGGGQEFRMRGGTENTANIVGLATALKLVTEERTEHTAHIQALRDELLAKLLQLPGLSLNGHPTQRLPNNINLQVEGHSGETLVMRLDMEGISVSSGSACSSGKTEPSHVLLAMGQPEEAALSSLRISLGRTGSSQEVENFSRTFERLFIPV